MKQHEDILRRCMHRFRKDRLVTLFLRLVFRFRDTYARNVKHKLSDEKYEME